MIDTGTFRNRLFYGIGITGQTIFDTLIGSFLILYATDILGLDALLFAALLVVPRIADVLIDFFIMYFVGRTRSRYGMYRPWLLSAFGTAVCVIIIFSVSYLRLSDRAALVVIFIAYFLSEVIFTSLYWIPYSALPGVITEASDELVRLSSSMTRFDYMAALLVNCLMMPILLACGGYRNPRGWLVAALVFSAISLICSMLCFGLVKTDPELERRATKEYSVRDVFRDYRYIICDRQFILTALILILVYLAVYINSSVSYYFYIYNLGIEDRISYIAIIAAVFALLATLLTNYLKRRLGYARTLIIAALLGPSGGGKSTLLDLLLGLFTPTEGTIAVDGRDISTCNAAWRSNISYIPQSIFLLDDTIERNIAYGCREDEIDPERLRSALRNAELYDFVEALPEREKTMIGENGIRLSGGQRQRIGIARALYRNTNIIVSDEATSAIDYRTARKIFANIDRLKGERTLIIATHREESVKNADVVYAVNGATVREREAACNER